MPQQSTNGSTKHVSLSVSEAASRLASARSSAAQDGASTKDKPAKAAAPSPEREPESLSPEVTNLDHEESDAGGSAGDDEATAAGDGADQDDDAKDPIYRMTVDGEEVDVPLSELLASYSRGRDYTRKTQALAEERRAVEGKVKEVETLHASLTAEQQRIATERQQYDAALTALNEVLKTADDEYAKVDWDQLEQDDPIEAQRQWRRYQQHKERKAEAERESARRERERAKEAEQLEREASNVLRSEMAKHFPQWSDDSVRTKDWGDMAKTAKALGFSDAEINATRDARIFRLLHKAMRNDRIEAAKERAKSAAPKDPAKEPAKVIPPGGARPAVRAGTAGARDAFARFTKTRSINDAAAFLGAARRRA